MLWWVIYHSPVSVLSDWRPSLKGFWYIVLIASTLAAQVFVFPRNIGDQVLIGAVLQSQIASVKGSHWFCGIQHDDWELRCKTNCFVNICNISVFYQFIGPLLDRNEWQINATMLCSCSHDYPQKHFFHPALSVLRILPSIIPIILDPKL